MSLEILISCFIPSIYRLVEAGFFAGDVLLAFNGKPIKELKHSCRIHSKTVPGRPPARYSAFSKSQPS
jgi:hypothetical protein